MVQVHVTPPMHSFISQRHLSPVIRPVRRVADRSGARPDGFAKLPYTCGRRNLIRRPARCHRGGGFLAVKKLIVVVRARAWRVGRLAQGPVRPRRTRPVDRGHGSRRGLIRVWRHAGSRESHPALGGEPVSDTSPVSLVCCDVVGAAAVDDSVLERAFAEAIATQGVVTGTAAYVRSMVQFDRTRGWPPADVMQEPVPRGRDPGSGREPRLRAVVPGGRGPVRGPAAARRERGAGQAHRGRAPRSAWCPACPGPRSA